MAKSNKLPTIDLEHVLRTIDGLSLEVCEWTPELRRAYKKSVRMLSQWTEHGIKAIAEGLKPRGHQWFILDKPEHFVEIKCQPKARK